MKVIGHLELIRKAIDDFAAEHKIEGLAKLDHIDLLNALDSMERNLNRQDFLENSKE